MTISCFKAFWQSLAQTFQQFGDKKINQMNNLINNYDSYLPKKNFINFGEICKNIYPLPDRLRFPTFVIPVP